ncbi:CDP-diacylglycerol--glycerol-3-phosphate 3-phosphatidyltransferase [Motilibacter peucedani]|uniref:CDP-diacylglycerol--glycerol-3-phosphate 3-phosphatidyltransferase n=1 Tax=Motilibacter peucedani TaxID=598650 RepID=A0A420XPH0_9ACTN|nr:CDP-alcohol phosphatidyltransferase family protein [Motilibacter peucedani]RKS74087.1 CDP-diacylglycerol--glycerol-3-phosphate 3-phosphatidyltransferase [Motilibacter peucedani]
MLSRAEYLSRWSELHGGYDPARSRWVLGWLTTAYACARPLVALRASPDAVTLLGLLLGAGVPAAAAAGAHWPVLGAALAGLTGLADGLDGAVAVVTGRTTRWGYVLDSVVDRLTDLALLAALGLLGAPWALVAAVASLTFVQEYARARAAAAGLSEIGVVTPWERPTRIVVVALFGLGAGLWPSAAGTWVGAAAWLGLVLAVGSVVLLGVVLRRQLR